MSPPAKRELWASWESYRTAQLVPAGFTSDQERELRRAFFAGAFGACCELVGVGQRDTRLKLAELVDEGHQFAQAVESEREGL